MFNILVVDDDKNLRKLIRALLEAENYTVFTADNGLEALNVLGQKFIDLVVLDIMMPKMDGYEFTECIRKSKSDLPILMVSAKQMPSDKHKGFLGFLRGLSLNALAKKSPFGVEEDASYYAVELSQLPKLETDEENAQVFLTKFDGDVQSANFLSSLKKIK